MKVVPLKKHAFTKLPNRLIRDDFAVELSVLGVRFVLYAINQWVQHKRYLRFEERFGKGDASSVSKLLKKTPEFEVTLHELSTNLRPYAEASTQTGDYRPIHDLVKELVRVVVWKQEDERWCTAYGLFHHIGYDSLDRSTIRFALHPKFEHFMDKFEQTGFTIVPLADAFALTDRRQLSMFLVAASVEKLYYEHQHEFEMRWLRFRFDLRAETYNKPNMCMLELKRIAAAVTRQTNYNITLSPVKEGRKILAVRFDVSRKRLKLRKRR